MDCSGTLLAPWATAEAEVENLCLGCFGAIFFTAVAPGSIENQSCVEVPCRPWASAGLSEPASFCRPLILGSVGVGEI